MDIKECSKKVCDYLDSLSREEFIKLLIEAGLKAEEGEGKIIFEDEEV
jgi:hypothetical protein